ncbi:putative UDP-glucose flavonoid 3-o-glucosyltransferase 3 [Phtheirospermum japonicum]|uniref:Glycosyltransferase n=1 Tax=Phtheirospermum japonicum TaxID=374723 RepID=A0A830CQS9_9LAMI|nr:putative UDP-glucose flavonoid 3-o-glucosyltransferase 3 [Phtheirospermum japonicum]
MEGIMKAELVFIPSPGRGHLLATLEMAKLLVDRDKRLSITVLVIKPFNDPKSIVHSYNSNDSDSNPGIRFVDLPEVIEPQSNLTAGFVSAHTQFINSHKNHVRNEVAKIVHGLDSNSTKLGGFVVDIFCTGMIDVAGEFGVPMYVFFTSGAATLGLMLHFQGMMDYQNQDLSVYEDSNNEIPIPSYEYPVPAKLLPPFLFDKDSNQMFIDLARRVRQAKGVIVNTFSELETPAMKFLSQDEDSPPFYSVGPILHVDCGDDENPKHLEIMKWLDEQPDSSVVFLCFGSKGCFDEIQVKEIAVGLEKSGHRFLWSLRKPPGENKHETPGEYENPGEVLPEGFIQRTAGTGKVIGWAPQVAVLSHRAVGGFVSHCGWNSTLESIWCGVPMAVWPLYAEQSTNAFQLVRDLGVAVEINMEYKKSFTGANMIVSADEIENGIRRLMERESDIRVKTNALKVKSRMSVVENGSSFDFVRRFIDDVMVNID